MDAQTIAVATAVISATVGALALVLNWTSEHEPRYRWLFPALLIAIVATGVVGVAVVFRLGTGNPADETAGVTPSRLTVAEYRRQLSSVCAERKERADRVVRIEPQGAVGTVLVQIEEAALRDIRAFRRGLRPPVALETGDRDMVALWTRRIDLIEEAHRRSETFTDREAVRQASLITRVTDQLNRSFHAVGVPECVF